MEKIKLIDIESESKLKVIEEKIDSLDIKNEDKDVEKYFKLNLLNAQINPIFSLISNLSKSKNEKSPLKYFCENFLTKNTIELQELKELIPETFSIVSIIRNKILTYNQFQLNLFTDKSYIYKFIFAFLLSKSIVLQENTDNNSELTEFISSVKAGLINDLLEDCISEIIDLDKKEKKYLKPQYFASNIVSLFLLLSFISIYTNIGILFISDSSNIDELIETIYKKSEKVNVKLSSSEGLTKEVLVSLDNLVEVIEEIQSPQSNKFFNFIKGMNLNEKLFLTCMNHYYSGGVENKVEEIKQMESYKIYIENKNKENEINSNDKNDDFDNTIKVLKEYLVDILDIENFCKLVYLNYN